MINLSHSSNPALNERIFQKEYTTSPSAYMTINGTMNKTALSLLLLIAGAIFSWNKFFNAITPEEGMAAVMPWLAIGGIGGFITALITVFRPKNSAITVPIYSVFEGLLLGSLSATIESMYSGIVMRAVSLTLAVFAAMLFFYRSGIIKVTQKFTMILLTATAGIALTYFVSFIAGLFGAPLTFLYGSGSFSIIFSLIVVGVAALNLILDFSFIEQAASHGAPKHMEWYGAFGLMVTLIWLYMEILRLLAKLANRE